jgi:hypothetical protein
MIFLDINSEDFSPPCPSNTPSTMLRISIEIDKMYKTRKKEIRERNKEENNNKISIAQS